MTNVSAIIPVKHLGFAKQRLSDALSAGERRELARWMLEDVLAMVKATPVVSDLIIASCDPEVARIAEREKFRIISDPSTDLNQTVDMVCARLAQENVERVIVLPTDIPLAGPDDLNCLVASHIDFGDDVTIAAARKDFGTNCLVMRPPASMPVCFGTLSGLRHVERAEQYKLRAHALCIPGLDLDIDDAGDIAQFMKRARSGMTWKYLRNIRMAERIAAYRPEGVMDESRKVR